MINKLIFYVFIILVVSAQQAYSQTSSIQLNEYIDRNIVSSYAKEGKSDYKSLISCLGALAGQSVQEGLRVELIENKNIPEKNVFAVVETNSNEKFYFGPYFDGFLFESDRGTDFWTVLTKDYPLNMDKLPSIDKMAAHNAKLVGSKEYGRHSIDDEYQPTESPTSCLNKHWTPLYSELKKERLHPLSWGWEITTYTKKYVLTNDLGIPKEVAIQIFMESAISMSKYNFKR